jgi:hypothetical protein
MEHQGVADTSVQSSGVVPSSFRARTMRPVCIHYGGHDFIASPEMAGIFLRHAQQLVDDDDAQLVPLLHRDGIELLYVDAEIPFSVRDATDEPKG